MYTIQWYDTLEDRWVSYSFNVMRAGLPIVVKENGKVVLPTNDEYTQWRKVP